jgi:hypothetical protein
LLTEFVSDVKQIFAEPRCARDCDSHAAGTDVVGHGEKAEEKHCVVYKRFYHLFKEGETERLFEAAGGNVLLQGYYDHANWCAIVEKTVAS